MEMRHGKNVGERKAWEWCGALASGCDAAAAPLSSQQSDRLHKLGLVESCYLSH